MRETLIRHDKSADCYIQCFRQVKVTGQFISKLLDSRDKCFSVEICPERKFHSSLLPELNLNFCSVTWRIPSSAQLENVEEIPAIQLAKQLSYQGYNVLLHLAGRNLRRNNVVDILNEVKRIGVRNIFAIQGDPSQIIEKDDSKCDFPYAADLVKFIKLNFGNYFCIGVAGYPNKHPWSKNLKQDTFYLKEKVTSGADFIITQASYDYESFSCFYDLCKKSNIHLPIIPGIFIINSYKTLLSISKFCAIPVSSDVLDIVRKNQKNPEAVKEFGIYHATQLLKNFLTDRQHIFGGIHIFSLNDLELVQEVAKRLGIFENRLEYPL